MRQSECSLPPVSDPHFFVNFYQHENTVFSRCASFTFIMFGGKRLVREDIFFDKFTPRQPQLAARIMPSIVD
jgi:hypothetical protein